MNLAEKILKQPGIDTVVWLLVIILTQFYNVKEQNGQREIQNQQFEKKITRKHNGYKTCAQGYKKFKEKPDAKWNKESCNLKARFQQLSFKLLKRN